MTDWLCEDRRVFAVEWRDERKIVEAKSPRQAIGMAVPEWDTGPISTLTVTELVPASGDEPLRSDPKSGETTVFGYPYDSVLTLIYEAKKQGRLR